MNAHLEIDPELAPSPARVALVWAEGIAPPFAEPGLPEFLAEIVDRARAAGEAFWPGGRRERVRDMLRHGRYKPSGRSKPASEFLLRAALSGEFPAVCGPVDVNNAISLESGLPASIFDARLSGPQLLLRRGRAGESYVFNPAGQSIELQDLLLVCRRDGPDWTPCGNPVKDAMATKIQADTRQVVAVLFVPLTEPRAEAERWGRAFADRLSSHCRAAAVGCEVVG